MLQSLYNGFKGRDLRKKRLIKLTKHKNPLATGEQSIRFRTVPIRDTITHVRQLPKSAILYKCAASRFWQFRVFLEGAQRKRSTQTEDIDEASRKAKLIYADMLQNIHGSEQGKRKLSTKNALDVVAKSLFTKQEFMIKQGELNKNKNKIEGYVYEKHIKHYFQNKDIKKINADALEHFKMYLIEQKLSKSTQKVYFNLMSKLLKEAVKKDYITHVPILPRIRMEDDPRGYFDNGEYTRLWKAAKKHIGKIYSFEYKQKPIVEVETEQQIMPHKKKSGPKKRVDADKFYRSVKITVDCYHAILFMRNTYIRPTDLKYIRHIDVNKYKHDNITLLELRHKSTKRHSAYMASTPQAVEYYQRILEQRKKEGDFKETDYIFFPKQENREYALKELTRQFNAIMEITNLKTDRQNKQRTLYSLRHTAIVSAIRSGIPIPIIAANSRTSVDMINRFYGSHINSALEMGSHLINNARKRIEKAEQKRLEAEAKRAEKEQQKAEAALQTLEKDNVIAFRK